MDYKQFKRINDYIGTDKYVYLVIMRNHGVEMSEEKSILIEAIKKIEPSKYIMLDVHYGGVRSITLQNCKIKKRSNSIMIKRGYLEEVLNSLGITLIDSLKTSLVFAKTKESIDRQFQRLKERMTKNAVKDCTQRIIREKYKSTIFNNDKIISNCHVEPRFRDWIKTNKKELVNNATNSETYLVKRMAKSFGKKMKVQQPFVINGKCYYADICIKAKRVIIEVDGLYHDELAQASRDFDRDKAFKSIGYETIRITNEDVKDSKKVSELIKRINNKVVTNKHK